MKKNKLLISLMMAMMPLSVLTANKPVNLQVEIINPQNGHDNPHRGPIFCPNVSLDNHTLYFNNVGYDLTMVLLDEDGDDAYTAYVPAGTSAVVLPATLCGDYEILLYPCGGSYYFFGWVEL